MKIKLPVIYLFCIYGITGCAGVVDDTANALGYERIEQKEEANNIHYYVSELAEQLLRTSQVIKMNKSIAIGTILPIEDVGGNKLPSVNPIGHQIQESFMTLMTQAGLKVIEFKMAKAIRIEDNRDFMLSRDIKELNTRVQADYYLTGTFIEQENDIAVNVRLIDVKSQKVLAAATDFIPNNVMWQPYNSTLKSNLIFRDNP